MQEHPGQGRQMCFHRNSAAETNGILAESTPAMSRDQPSEHRNPGRNGQNQGNPGRIRAAGMG